MKVFDISTKPTEQHVVFPAANRPNESDHAHGFRRQLTTMNQAVYRRYIDGLKEQIDSQGEILQRKADMKELQKYRQLITELLNETVSNSYALCNHDAFDTRGRHRVLTVIRKVNEKLDNLTKDILSGQADNLTLLETVDDIRGLLVDMFL